MSYKTGYTGASTGGGGQGGMSPLKQTLQRPRLHAIPIIHPITGVDIVEEMLRSEKNRGATSNFPAQTEKEEKKAEFNSQINKAAASSSESEASQLLPLYKLGMNDDQMSPFNPEGKKKYDRLFLLRIQNKSQSIKKPENLPDIIMKESTKRELNAAMRGILNKLTPQNFEKLVKQVLKLPIDTMDKLVGVINLVFDKAVDEPHFPVVYAELCTYLNDANIDRQVRQGEDSNNNNFKKILLKPCQKDFRKYKAAEYGLHEREKEIKKKEMRLVMEEDERRMKRKSVGVTRCIGELYKLGMINQSTIVTCIEAGDEESFVQVRILITTEGKVLEEELQKVATGVPNSPNLHVYFNKIKNIVNERKTSRVRFMLQDVIDLKNREWVPRRNESNPMKMDEVNLEEERETMEQNQLTFLQMSRGSMAGGMGQRGDGKHNQRSPSNPEEKKKYERDFLLRIQNKSQSIKKPENLPDIIMKESTKRVNKETNYTSRRARIRQFISRITKCFSCFRFYK